MNKIVLIIATVMLMAAGNVGAQKTAHINSQDVLMNMPESKSAQESLEKLQKDAMDELGMMETIYKKKIEEYTDFDLDGWKSFISMSINNFKNFMNLSPEEKERFDNFGLYEDAIVKDEPWMYHSGISIFQNYGLLIPANTQITSTSTGTKFITTQQVDFTDTGSTEITFYNSDFYLFKKSR
mgnify:CR=1 FL=1